MVFFRLSFVSLFFLRVVAHLAENVMTHQAETTTEESVYKTVLCVFKDRRRPITFKASGDAQTERQNLLDAVRVTFSDVLSCGEGSSASSYFLQTESSEWGGMIDLLEHIEDRGTVYVCHSTNVRTY